MDLPIWRRALRTQPLSTSAEFVYVLFCPSEKIFFSGIRPKFRQCPQEAHDCSPSDFPTAEQKQIRISSRRLLNFYQLIRTTRVVPHCVRVVLVPKSTRLTEFVCCLGFENQSISFLENLAHEAQRNITIGFIWIANLFQQGCFYVSAFTRLVVSGERGPLILFLPGWPVCFNQQVVAPYPHRKNRSGFESLISSVLLTHRRSHTHTHTHTHTHIISTTPQSGDRHRVISEKQQCTKHRENDEPLCRCSKESSDNPQHCERIGVSCVDQGNRAGVGLDTSINEQPRVLSASLHLTEHCRSHNNSVNHSSGALVH